MTVADRAARVHRLVGQLPRPADLPVRLRPVHAAARPALAVGARPHELPGAARRRRRRDGAGRRSRSRSRSASSCTRTAARAGWADERGRGRGRAQALRRRRRAGRRRPRGARGRAARRRRPVRLRQEHAAPLHRRPRGRRRGHDPDRRPRRHERPPGCAQRLDGLPELRALPAPDRVGEHRLRARRPRRAESARCASASTEAAALVGVDRAARAAAVPALGRRAAARRARPRARPASPTRYLLDEPLSNLDAGTRVRDADGAAAPPPRGRRDDGARHPRPGRGDDARRPHRRAATRAASARSARRTRSTASRATASSPPSSARRR